MARKRVKSARGRQRKTDKKSWPGLRKVLSGALKRLASERIPVVKEIIETIDADDQLARDESLLRRLDRLARAINRNDSNLGTLTGEILEELRSRRGPSSILRPMALDLGNRINPASLLHARYGVAPFLWNVRERERQELESWCEDEAACSVRLFVGPGGVGKTRLFIRWTEELRKTGWHAGFLPDRVSCEDIDLLCQANRPVFIVVDYVENHRHLVELMENCAARTACGIAPLRIALLTRQAGDWCTALSNHSLDVEFLLAQSEPVALEQMPLDGDLRQLMFNKAYEAFAKKRGKPSATPTPVSLEDDLFERPLYIQMAALAAVDGLDLSAQSLVEGILRHEIRYACKGQEYDAAKMEAISNAACRILTAIALRGGVATLEEAEALNANGGGASGEFVRRLNWLYPAESPDAHIRPMEPDLLGEALVRKTLAHPETPSDFLDKALNGVGDRGLAHCLTILGRCAYGGTLRLPGTPSILRALQRHVPERTLSLREVAVLLLEKQLTFERHSSGNQETLGHICTSLGKRLGDLGRHEDALAATQEAVKIWRQIDDKGPDAFLPQLAMGLNNLGIWLSALGRHDDALAATQESVGIRRHLVEKRPDEFLPDLAMGLNNLGEALKYLGCREDAFLAAQEAVDIRRSLAEKRSDAFLPALAESLNNLGNRLCDFGRHEDALAATQEAVDIRRLLVGKRPDAFLPDLPMSLNNLSNRFTALGRREDALAATQEAVERYRSLAEKRPKAFLPDLAMSLNNLGNSLGDLGHHADALAAMQEAVDISRGLAEVRPDAFLPDLAGSLSNLSISFSCVGQHGEAHAAAQEAVDISRGLAKERPDAYLPALAGYVTNLGIMWRRRCKGRALGGAEEK